jgi:hypothetical protein
MTKTATFKCGDCTDTQMENWLDKSPMRYDHVGNLKLVLVVGEEGGTITTFDGITNEEVIEMLEEEIERVRKASNISANN